MKSKSKGSFGKMPPHSDGGRMPRTVGSGGSGSGTALPPNTTNQWGTGPNRASRTPGHSKVSGGKSVMPPNSGPGRAARSAGGKTSHGKSSYAK